MSEAQQWVGRSRTSWPSSDIISKIILCGVLFVPIDSKGSIQENIEWRISFSIAEKVLIFSFSHTQLLCYALIKIFLKDILNKHEDLKGVLCSYLLKTLMFWVSEESDPFMWRPGKIIQCFMACLQRLVYCVEYATLLHYFIPDNNLFHLRFDDDKKVKMMNVLKKSYKQGIHCFSQSETLCDYFKLPFVDMISPMGNLVTSIQNTISFTDIYRHNPQKLLYNFLHYSRSDMSRTIFIELLSQLQFECVLYLSVQQILQNQPIVACNNKQI